MLDFEGVAGLDATALDVLVELVARVGELGMRVVGVARANDRVLARLALAALLEPSGPLRVFPTIHGAVRVFRQRD